MNITFKNKILLYNMNKIYIYIIILIIFIIILKTEEFVFYMYNLYNYIKSYDINNNLIIKNKKKLKKFLNKIKSKNKTIFIIPHLEIGDNIIINGMIRYYLTDYRVVLVCKDMFKKQIEYMYEDILKNNLNKLFIYNIRGGTMENKNIYNELPIDDNIKIYMKSNNIELIVFNLYKVYYSMIPIYNENYPSLFYTQLNLDKTIQYTKFKIPRNYDKEDILYQKLINIVGKNYIIVWEDIKRKLIINKKYITKKIPIFKLGFNSINEIEELNNLRDDNIFNYIKILNNAIQIHTIDSSLLILIDILQIKGDIYNHIYVKKTKTHLQNKYIKSIL